MPPAPLVTLDRVSYYYPHATSAALLNVDLTVRAGEIVGLLGATGAGKTTLCLALNGIVPQFHGGRFFGHVQVAGLDTVTEPIHQLARHVGMVFQDPATQLVTASVENEVAFVLENLSVSREEIRERVNAALLAVGLLALARKHPHELSGGQQQRLALAAALVLEPPLIVLDEPTSQLDPVGAATVFQLVRDLNAKRGTTFLITGHAPEEMADTAQRLIVLSQGRVAADGTPQEIYRDAALLARERLRAPEVTQVFVELRDRGLTSAAAPVQLDDGLRLLGTLPAAQPFNPPPAPSPDTGNAVLELADVTYTYPDGTAALKGITLAIRRREYVVLLGQNGAGKSTLIRQFLRLLEPTTGTVRLDGAPLTQHPVTALAQRIGYVPQNPDRQLFNATVEAEVGYALQRRPLATAEKQRRIDAALAAMELTPHRHAHPFALAKGDRARVVIAAILVLEPEILIFDEPTTGQDNVGAHAILALTRQLHERGCTVIVVTHHLSLMPGYATRAVVLGGGRVLLDAPLREAYHALDVLRATHLAPTQAVVLARAAHPGNRAITPAELADSFAPAP